MEVQNLPRIEGFDVSYVQSKGSWIDPIVTYIRDGTLPVNPSEARKIRVRSSRFMILNDELYKRGFSQPYLRCLTPDKLNYVMKDIHEGACGNHSRARSLIHKIVCAG